MGVPVRVCIYSAAFFLSSLITGVWGACTNPTVRREWRTLSDTERADWIAAVNCLNQLPHSDTLTSTVNPEDIVPVNSSGSYYDDIVYVHMDLNHRIHSTGLFLPWHRFYVQMYENDLKDKCGYEGISPYWNWTIDNHDIEGGSMFQDSDPLSGLGGWGDLDDDNQVPDGGFSQFTLSYPGYHSLRREWTPQPWLTIDESFFEGTPYSADELANVSFTPEIIDSMRFGNVGNFTLFQLAMERDGAAHGTGHVMMGGDLGGTCPASAPDCTPGPIFSPNEPMFWMHHAMVDKVWFDWQNANTANGNMFSGGSVQMIDTAEEVNEYPNGAPPYLNLSSTVYGDGLWPDYTVQDVISTTDGILCYVYE